MIAGGSGRANLSGKYLNSVERNPTVRQLQLQSSGNGVTDEILLPLLAVSSRSPGDKLTGWY